MPCVRGCVGISICEGNTCCIQIRQDCGTGCAGISSGFSRIQIDALGRLEVCSNVGGNCTCNSFIPGTDSLTDNGDGTYTHVAVDTTVQDIDICSALQFCTIGQLGNVDPTADAPIDGQVLTWDALSGMWIPDDECCDNAAVVANVAPPDVDFDDLDGNPATDFPAVQTPFPQTCTSITNPSATKSMLVGVTFQEYNVDAFFNTTVPPITVGFAVLPDFYIDGVRQGNPPRDDVSWFINNVTGNGVSGAKVTSGLTRYYIIPPGAMTEACSNFIFRPGTPTHNADATASVQVSGGKIEMFGKLI